MKSFINYFFMYSENFIHAVFSCFKVFFFFHKKKIKSEIITINVCGNINKNIFFCNLITISPGTIAIYLHKKKQIKIHTLNVDSEKEIRSLFTS